MTGRGRPSKGDDAKRQPLNMRTDAVMRSRIEGAAAISGLSLSQEVERRLITSFIQDDFLGGPHTAPIARMLIGTIGEIERERERNWRADLETWWAVKEAVNALLDLCRPAPTKEWIEEVQAIVAPYEQAEQRRAAALADLDHYKAELRARYGLSPNSLAGIAPQIRGTEDEQAEYERRNAQYIEADAAYRKALDVEIEQLAPLANRQKEAKAMGLAIAQRVFEANGPRLKD